MAEIGLIASIFGVASFGTKVATNLYEAADIMIHAHQQIASMAKHVSQFTAVLRHLGRVLEAEKGSCSNELLREIRKIKRSCKSTFKEISATVMSRQFRPFVPVRWLFKKSKAKELEARLDSEQSMLQVMIHTITVSKLGDMQSKSKEDSKQLLGLKDEISLLKTLIIENYNNSIELQHAEHYTELESRGIQSLGTDIRQGPPPYHPQEPLTAGPPDIIDLDHTTSQVPPSPRPRLYESDNEDGVSARTADSVRATTSQGHVDEVHSDASTDDAHATDEIQASTSLEFRLQQLSILQQMSTYDSNVGSSTNRASTSLLQMVPYRPNAAYSTQRNRFISAGSDTVPGSAMEEATRSVRLLLDKWTTSGSAPVSKVLTEIENTKPPAQDTGHRNRQIESNFSRPRTPPRRRPRRGSFTNEFSDDEFETPFYSSHDYGNPDMQGHFVPPPGSLPMPPNTAWGSPGRPAYMRTKDVWMDGQTHNQVPARYVGDDILRSLRYTHGGIVYTKSSDFHHSYFVDHHEFYRVYLAPVSLIQSKHFEIQTTDIGKGWVRREALDLLGYSYSETPSGYFSIPRNLEFTEIEELVVYSYQADNRRLAERSRQLVKERGWHERIAALSRDIPKMAVNPSFPEPQIHPSPTLARYSGSGVEFGRGLHQSGMRDNNNATSPPGRQNRRQPGYYQDANPENRPNATEGARERNPAASEVRFTVPRLDSARQNARGPSSPEPPINPTSNPNIQQKSQQQELQEAIDKLNRLKSNRDEAKRAKNHILKADLEYYAIPDQESRIEALKQDLQRDERDKNGALDEKQSQAPHTVVETDSEGSESG